MKSFERFVRLRTYRETMLVEFENICFVASHPLIRSCFWLELSGSRDRSVSYALFLVPEIMQWIHLAVMDGYLDLLNLIL